MKKFFILLIAFILINVQTYAFQDGIVINKDKLTDINIEDNSVVDVFPLTTIMNDKNTLIVHPLKEGKTRFCVLKNGKTLALFTVEITEFETLINSPAGFEVFILDTPEEAEEYGFKLDIPPAIKSNKTSGEING